MEPVHRYSVKLTTTLGRFISRKYPYYYECSICLRQGLQTTPRPTGQIWPAEPFHPVANTFFQWWKNNIFAKNLLIRQNVIYVYWNNNITQGFRPSNCYVKIVHFSNGGGRRMFSRGATVLKFRYINWKLRAKHFYTKQLLRKYQISKSEEQGLLPPPFRRHRCRSGGAKFSVNVSSAHMKALPYSIYMQQITYKM